MNGLCCFLFVFNIVFDDFFFSDDVFFCWLDFLIFLGFFFFVGRGEEWGGVGRMFS